jgi:hypothetical protein
MVASFSLNAFSSKRWGLSREDSLKDKRTNDQLESILTFRAVPASPTIHAGALVLREIAAEPVATAFQWSAGTGTDGVQRSTTVPFHTRLPVTIRGVETGVTLTQACDRGVHSNDSIQV